MARPRSRIAGCIPSARKWGGLSCRIANGNQCLIKLLYFSVIVIRLTWQLVLNFYITQTNIFDTERRSDFTKSYIDEDVWLKKHHNNLLLARAGLCKLCCMRNTN